MKENVFKDQVAIVTGAGRGLGAEEAKQLAAQGAKVVISDIDMPGGGSASARLVSGRGSRGNAR